MPLILQQKSKKNDTKTKSTIEIRSHIYFYDFITKMGWVSSNAHAQYILQEV